MEQQSAEKLYLRDTPSLEEAKKQRKMHFLPQLLKLNRDKEMEEKKEQTKMNLNESNQISKQNIAEEMDRTEKIEENGEDLSAIELR